MSAQIIRFPAWAQDKKSIDSEEEMVAFMIHIQARGEHPYRSPREAAEFGRLVWREFKKRGLPQAN